MVLKTKTARDAAATFNLVDEAWIPVRQDGSRRLVGLDELFRTAHEIQDLDCAAHERIALLRLLVCITHAAFGAPESPEEWGDFGAELAAKVPQYLQRSDVKPHFNLLGDGPRFLQVPVAGDKEPVDITKLVFHLATGNNPTLLDHEGGLPRTLHPAKAALALLTFQNFYPPYGAGHKGKGPCVDRNMIHTVLEAGSIAGTILQNCLTRDFITEYFPDMGRPLWELAPQDSAFTQKATTSYLGRLVPRHRSVWLRDSLDGFVINQQGMEYPNFEEAREPTATLRIYKKADVTERGLLDCKVDRAIWRDLHAILVVKHAQANEMSGPLNLQVRCRRSGEPFQIWTGGLVTDGKAKIFDAIESTFTIPSGMLTDEGRAFYQAGVEFAETQSGRLKWAVTEYSKAMKHESPATAKAQSRFWHVLDRESPLLLELVGKPMPLAYAEAGNPWGDLVRRAAREAYEATCPRQTPRQIKAFAAGLKKLSVPNPKIPPTHEH